MKRTNEGRYHGVVADVHHDIEKPRYGSAEDPGDPGDIESTLDEGTICVEDDDKFLEHHGSDLVQWLEREHGAAFRRFLAIECGEGIIEDAQEDA